MRAVIRTDGLGKQYRICHERQGRYATFRDMLSERFAKFGRKYRKEHEELFWALRDVNLNIQEGERVGIIGRNGAGKSTLLKLLSRITEPSRGRLCLRGRVASLLEVGTGFHPELSGRENIYLNGAILGMRRQEIRRRFDEIVAFAEVEKFLDTPVKRYSSGMYTRLAFAVAAHLESDLMLIDEVLAVGDEAFQNRCLNKMRDVTSSGRTVALVSHRLSAIETLCDRVLVFEEGRLAEDTQDVRAAIRLYLSFNESSGGCSWNAQNDLGFSENTRPTRLYLSGPDGARIDRSISNVEPVNVNIEVDVKSLDPALNIGYALINAEGHLLYWTTHMDMERAAWPALRPGLNHLVTPLPRRLLNEGDYFLDMMVSLHYRKWIFQPGKNSPRIRLSVRGGLSDSPTWAERRPGLLAPVLAWRSEVRA
jgi:lipopolysaccharide transport system ATP-binding protein